MHHKPIVLKQTLNKQELNNREDIVLAKNKDLITNSETLPADYLTKKFILNPVKRNQQRQQLT